MHSYSHLHAYLHTYLQIPFIYMHCINSFRIFFLRKKPFNIIWKKKEHSKFSVLTSLKKFSSESLSSSVSEKQSFSDTEDERDPDENFFKFLFIE